MNIIPIIIYFFIGAISFSMAYKSIFSNQFIPFQEKAAGKTLAELDERVQSVIIALMRLSGLGFFIIGILLTVFPIVNYYFQNIFIQYAIPLAAIFYCLGLSIINYELHKKTNVATPWQRSLYAAFVVLVAFVISII